MRSGSEATDMEAGVPALLVNQKTRRVKVAPLTESS